MSSVNFLSGAHGRLLPPSIPFRFFTAAMIFYALFWASLLLNAEDVTGYMIGGGPVLGTIHLATLGVLTMTVIGASLQLLSVATRRAFKGFWICRLLSWVFIPGFLLLACAMYVSWSAGMLAGALLAGGGLLIFFYLIIDNIRGVRGMAAVMAHCWGAMLSLLALVVLGVMLIIDMEQGFMADHLAMAVSHMVLAVFGFMGLLAMGFSYILVPMFALSPAPSEKLGRLSCGGMILAIILVVTGVNSGLDGLVLSGIFAGLAGAGLYLRGMTGVYRARMKRRLGTPFVLIRSAWVILPITLLWAAVGQMGYWPETGHGLFAALAIIGWLLTFLVGVLQRILPFLSSMHTSGSGGIPMLASSMADEKWLRINAVGHLGGFALVALGIILDLTRIIQIGAALGLIGAASLLGYLLIVVRHMIRNRPPRA